MMMMAGTTMMIVRMRQAAFKMPRSTALAVSLLAFIGGHYV